MCKKEEEIRNYMHLLVYLSQKEYRKNKPETKKLTIYKGCWKEMR